MKRYFIGTIVIIFSFALFSCKKTAFWEKEANNDFLTANKIEPDTVIRGYLSSPDDHDFYRLDIVIPLIIDIELPSVRGINHAIKIWKDIDNRQTEIKFIDDARKSSPERICNMFFDAGAYFIEILHGEGDNPVGNSENYFELRLTSKSGDGDEESEPNDDIEHANQIEVGIEMEGYFSPSFNKMNQNRSSQFREEDWYCFNVDIQNDPVLFDISLSEVQGVNSILDLLDSDGNEIASSDVAGGEGKRLEGIGIRKSGKYYVMITSNFQSNCTTSYKLLITSKTYDFSMEVEPNNNFETPNIISGNEISGQIFPEGDRDYYNFNKESLEKIKAENAIETEKVLYRFEGTSDTLDLILKVFDGNKKELFIIDNLKGPGKEIMPDANIKNNFYFEISSKRGEALSDIKGKDDFNYKLNITVFPYEDNYEIEPNDVKETASRIKSGKIMGFVSKKDDKDFYVLEYKNRVRKKITVQGIKDSELKISITDSLGFIIKTETVKDVNLISFNEMIDFKGYLIVESVVPNYEEPYIIELGE